MRRSGPLPWQRQIVVELCFYALEGQHAAERCGVHRSTISRWLRADPELRADCEALAAARMEAIMARPLWGRL